MRPSNNGKGIAAPLGPGSGLDGPSFFRNAKQMVKGWNDKEIAADEPVVDWCVRWQSQGEVHDLHVRTVLGESVVESLLLAGMKSSVAVVANCRDIYTR